MYQTLFTFNQETEGTDAWLLEQYALRFIAEIEWYLGPRDPSFSLIRVEVDLTPKATPRPWFPDSGIPPGDPEGRSRQIIIRLAPNALKSCEYAKWQLAHECVHLLDPWNKQVDIRPTNVLEEGLAAWYQNFAAPCQLKSDVSSYDEAESLVKPHTDELQNAVKQIRSVHGIRIGEISPEVLAKHCPRIDEGVVGRLCDRFDRNA